MIGARQAVAWALVFTFGLGPAVAAPQETQTLVERVEVEGNRYLRTDTLSYYISTKAGDRYDELRLKEDFQRLWDTGFLDDMSLEVLDGQSGKVVIFHVQERKRIQLVDYRGSKAATRKEIEERLKDKDADLKIDSFYNDTQAKRADAVIKALLEEKGRPFATVTHEERTLGGAGTQVTFRIDDGPEAKIREIVFEGNQIFDDAKLRGQMKKLKQGGFFNLSWLGGKRTYTEEKWSEDQENIREFYLNHGYVTASVGTPELVYTDGEGGVFKKKPMKWLKLKIPISEGQQYRVGKVEIEGSTVFKEEFLRSMFKLKTGDIYSEKRIEKGYEKLRDIYGAGGYIQWTALTKRNPDPERRVVDLVLSMQEDQRYFVGKITFTGNDSTRDKVIRREVYLSEGDVFSTELLKASIRRIDQLGYFKPIEDVPHIQPAEDSQDHLDVTFKVEEQNRNQFTFGGGVSGLEGTFINASFSTSNFLGLGETFEVAAQSGKRTKNYRLAITEPYLFDRPITAGIDLYRRRLEYRTYAEEKVQGYVDKRTGVTFTGGFPVGRFTRMYGNYTYELVDVSLTDTDEFDLNIYDPTQPSYVPYQYLYYQVGERRESRLTPSLVLNTVDNPFLPRAGKRLSATLQFAGGPLGGNMDYFRPNLEAVVYLPHTKHTAFGSRLEFGWIRPFGETAEIDPETGRNNLPWYQRFYLGGETQVRGFNIRSISPHAVNEDGQEVLVGGNKFLLFNAEYYFDFGSMIRFLFFFDAGQTVAEGQGFRFDNTYTSTGAELRFMMPVLNVPFRLIYAINPNRDPYQPRSTFKFAVGTTF
jgi:outer membrane protein insertion porin family